MVKRYDIHEDEEFGTTREYSDSGCYVDADDYAALQASHGRLLREMERFRPVIEQANADTPLWIRLTEGTGIATPNGYTHAIAAAQPFTETT